MEVLIRNSVTDVARAAANRVLECIRSSATPSLGLATGATQQGIYRLLIDAHETGEIAFDKVRFFMLDEYVGVPSSSTRSFQNVLRAEFLDPIDADFGSLEILDGNAADLRLEAKRFDATLRAIGGVDLQLLGIGTNGHIGFNEPGSPVSSRTRVVTLAQETIESNAHYFDSPADVPSHAISQGIGTIMEAKSIVLVANGEKKATAVAAMLEGPVGEECPASFLRDHPDVTVVLDEAAASLLRSTQTSLADAQL